MVKQNCAAVGESTLQFVLDLLKENGESEEYIEALELISKLVKPKNGEAALQNAQIIIEDAMNIGLLLDLLEHEDGLVGVMASEILTSVHSLAPAGLEKTIQDCPAGLTKLLNRMPDRSREEVSNQAIILVRQLTSSNEDMKKTVAFNEVSPFPPPSLRPPIPPYPPPLLGGHATHVLTPPPYIHLFFPCFNLPHLVGISSVSGP